jgi:parvulin-like peptidyl-prolyl isomerase
MGSSQTYGVTKDSLSQAMVGKGTQNEQINFYFLDETYGFYFLTMDEYERLVNNTFIVRTKQVELDLNIV